MPNNPKWKKLTDRSFSPTIKKVRCGERGNMVYVDLNEDGTMKSADLRLMTPKGVVLADKEAVADYLRKHGVRDKFISNIHKTKNNFWEAKHGNLSVTFSKYYPSYNEAHD